MPKFHFEKLVKAERNKVFEIVANFENFQKRMPKYFPSIRIKSSRGDTTIAEEHVRLAGLELVMMTKHITRYPELHEVFVIGGDAKGSHIIERYQSILTGTKIIVDVELKLSGKLRIANYLAKGRLQKAFAKKLDEFAKIAEL